jgi:hypothetical protein
MALARSPYAHARLLSVDLAGARKAPGVVAAYTVADLRADGIGHIAFPPIFKRAGGAPMAAPLRTPLCDLDCVCACLHRFSMLTNACASMHRFGEKKSGHYSVGTQGATFSVCTGGEGVGLTHSRAPVLLNRDETVSLRSP